MRSARRFTLTSAAARGVALAGAGNGARTVTTIAVDQTIHTGTIEAGPVTMVVIGAFHTFEIVVANPVGAIAVKAALADRLAITAARSVAERLRSDNA